MAVLTVPTEEGGGQYVEGAPKTWEGREELNSLSILHVIIACWSTSQVACRVALLALRCCCLVAVVYQSLFVVFVAVEYQTLFVVPEYQSPASSRGNSRSSSRLFPACLCDCLCRVCVDVTCV